MNFRAMLCAASIVALASCGGSSSSSERDRNIAGGGDVSMAVAPYQVSLFSFIYKDGVETDGGSACGGAIIAPQWVLTADHCIPRDSGVMHPEGVIVGNGDPDYWGSLKDWTNRRIGVAAYPARNVTGDVPNLDLMLIKVNKPFTYSTKVQPVSLPIGFESAQWPSIGTAGLITGWGDTLDAQPRTSLRGVAMKVNTKYGGLYCRDDSDSRNAYFDIPFPNSQLCLGRTNTDEKAAACKGDSGGPFVVTVGEKKYVAGVASKASAPANDLFNSCSGVVPNMYVRVTEGLNWMIPGVVQDFNARTTNGRVDLSWSPAVHQPALPVTDYQVEMRRVGDVNWSVVNDGVSTNTAASITGLNDGDNLEFRVSGINDVNANEATMRVYANMSLTVGVPPTTTTTSTTTTTVVTTTTLVPFTTTIAPSTTSRAIGVGPRPTTTTTPTTTTSNTAPKPTTTATTSADPASPQTTTAGSPPVRVVTVEDKSFSSPTIPTPPVTVPKVDKTPVATEAVRPQPAVGASWSATDVAQAGKVNLPSGGLVSVAVPAKSSKVCKSTGSGVVMVGTGTCKVTVSVKVGSGKPKNKTVSIKVS